MFEANLQKPVHMHHHLDLHEQMLLNMKESLNSTKKRLHDAELTLNLVPNDNDMAEQTVWNDKVHQLIETRDHLPFPALYDVRKRTEVKEMRDLEAALANRQKPRKVFKVEKAKLVRQSDAKDSKTANLSGSAIPGEVIGKIENYQGLNSHYNGLRLLVRKCSANVVGEEHSSLPPWFGPGYYEKADPQVLSPTRDDRYRVAFRATHRNGVQKERQSISKIWHRRNEVRELSRSLHSLPDIDGYSASRSGTEPKTLLSTALSSPSLKSSMTIVASKNTVVPTNKTTQREQIPHSNLGVHPTYTKLLPTSYGDHNALISHLLVNTSETLKSGLGRRKKPRDYTSKALALQSPLVHTALDLLRGEVSRPYEKNSPAEDAVGATSNIWSDQKDADEQNTADNTQKDAKLQSPLDSVAPYKIAGDSNARQTEAVQTNDSSTNFASLLPEPARSITNSHPRRRRKNRKNQEHSITARDLANSECLNSNNYYKKLPKRATRLGLDGRLQFGNVVSSQEPVDLPTTLDLDVLSLDADVSQGLRQWYLENRIHPRNHRFYKLDAKTQTALRELHHEEAVDELVRSADSYDSAASHKSAVRAAAYNREFAISRHQKQRTFMEHGAADRQTERDWSGLLLDNNPYTPQDEYVRKVAEQMESLGI